MPNDAGDGERFTDEELTVLALAADPDAPVPDDAVPFGSPDGLAVELLPSWYMPAPSLGHSRTRTIVFIGIAVLQWACGVIVGGFSDGSGPAPVAAYQWVFGFLAVANVVALLAYLPINDVRTRLASRAKN